VALRVLLARVLVLVMVMVMVMVMVLVMVMMVQFQRVNLVFDHRMSFCRHRTLSTPLELVRLLGIRVLTSLAFVTAVVL
jgi:hypothetical protein